jgi:hypothetical protein
MKRTGLVLGVAIAAGTLLPGAVRPAGADEWSDPTRVAIEAFLARTEAAQAGREASWVTKRLDDVAVFADLARVDVTLEVTNAGTAAASPRPLEWRRSLTVDPRAELIGAVYTRADGVETPSQTLAALDARRLYGTATTERHRDPLWITREQRDALEVTIFPVAPKSSVRVVLSFVTPLYGRGEQLEYRDPLNVRVRRGRPVTEPTTPTPGAPDAAPAPDLVAGAGRRATRVRPGLPAVTLPANAPPQVRDAFARATAEAQRDAIAAQVSPTSVTVTFQGVLPASPPEGVTWTPREDGTWRIEPSPEADVPPLHVRSIEGAAAARTFVAQGYPILTQAFAWRADPAAILASLGVEPAEGTTLRFDGLGGVSSRIAPDTAAADEDPLVVMGRTYMTDTVKLRVVAIGKDGKTLAKRDLVVPSDRTKPAEKVVDALRGYHRARLADRVARWAGDHPHRSAQALAYAVDMGVLRPGTAALAIPKDERDWLTKQDLKLYLTDGMPFDADSTQGDFTSPPAGSVR